MLLFIFCFNFITFCSPRFTLRFFEMRGPPLYEKTAAYQKKFPAVQNFLFGNKMTGIPVFI